MPEIACDTRWIGPHGIGRFAREVLARLGRYKPLPLETSPLSVLDPFRVRRALKKLRPAVYFSPAFNPPSRSPVPFVFTLNDLNHVKFPGESSLGRRLYYRRFVRPAARRAFRVLTVSEYSRQEIISWTGLRPERVVAVGCGVGPAFAPRGARCKAPYTYLFYCGGRRPHKNLPRLMEALKQSGLAPNIRLVLTGKQDKAAWRMIGKAGVSARVAFAGQIPDKQLPAWYRGAVAVVIPSLTEGFGLPALEAMACGTPVVASSVGGLAEVVGDAALIVNPVSVDSIAAGLRRIVEDRQLATELRRRGPQRAQRFGWSRVVKRIRDILEEAAAGGGGSP